MNPNSLVTHGEKIERAAGRLYKSLAVRFTEDSEASAFFYELAVEEERHAEFLKFVISMFNKVTVLSASDKDAEKAFDGALAAISAYEREIEAGGVDIKRALKIVFEVEQIVFESEYVELAAMHFVSLRNKFEEVMSDTMRHKNAAVALAGKYGVDISSGVYPKSR